MAKPLVFSFAGREFPFQLNKVDRSKLYGFKELEVLDAKKRRCELATLSGDGQTVVGRGGTALAYLSADGLWCEKGELKPIDVEGNEITPVTSSFNAPTELTEEVSIDEYMDHDIRIVYQMEPETDLGELREKLDEGVIYRFPFSYRGGVEPDVAFLLTGEDGNVFMLVGSRVQLEFVGLQQAAPAVEEDETEEDDGDAMDFDMI